MYRKILVPVDGSKRSEAILTHVEKLGRIEEAEVMLLKVEENPPLLEKDEVIDMEKFRRAFDARQKQSMAYLEELRSQLRGKGIPAETRLAHGMVVKTILAVAAEIGADLIVIATHGIGGSLRASFGSVAAGVLQAATIPLLLIRSDREG